jgi:predicted nucleic acid-binding protein
MRCEPTRLAGWTSAPPAPDVFVVDTSVLVDVLRGSPAAARWLIERDHVPWCSEITRIEILQGVRSHERGPTGRLLDGLRWVPVDATVSRRAGELGRQYRASHPGIGVAHLVIAATALELGAELATGNVRHYPMFEGLQPPYGP